MLHEAQYLPAFKAQSGHIRPLQCAHVCMLLSLWTLPHVPHSNKAMKKSPPADILYDGRRFHS